MKRRLVIAAAIAPRLVLAGAACALGFMVGCEQQAPKSPGPKSAYDTVAHSWLETMAAGQTNVTFLSSLISLPTAVRERLGPISDRGGSFSKGCIGPDPKRRFLTATEVGGVYNVAIEQGGSGYFWFIERFVVDGAGKVLEEERVKPYGPANRSHPARSEANQSPAAADSGR